MGLACSECFSGKNLYKLLKPGFDYEAKVMEDLKEGRSAEPLSIHTSCGVSPALDGFLQAIEKHLPWENSAELDWCVSLQIEGASGVFAAVDMCLQTLHMEEGNNERMKIAVGGKSYHGPPSTAFGARAPLWKKNHQLVYQAPVAGDDFKEEELLEQFREFLETHGSEIGVILFEPQLGSSQAAYPWPKDLLKAYIKLAKSYGIKIVCDEIMCGLGRHGQGSLFISQAWELDPDAVTFGKALGAGTFPISGAILRKGRDLLAAKKGSVMQSHTYCGSSTRALMAATAVLDEVPKWFPFIEKSGEEFSNIFRYLNQMSRGMLVCHGMGLMWGGVFSTVGQNADEAYRKNAVAVFKKHTIDLGIVPYHVPVGGFMVSPVYDIDVGTIYDVGERLEEAIKRTMAEVNWEPKAPSIDNSGSYPDLASLFERFSKAEQCCEVFHEAKICTACSKFVRQSIRTRFVEV